MRSKFIPGLSWRRSPGSSRPPCTWSPWSCSTSHGSARTLGCWRRRRTEPSLRGWPGASWTRRCRSRPGWSTERTTLLRPSETNKNFCQVFLALSSNCRDVNRSPSWESSTVGRPPRGARMKNCVDWLKSNILPNKENSKRVVGAA